MRVSIKSTRGDKSGSAWGWKVSELTEETAESIFSHDFAPGAFREGHRIRDEFIECHCLYGDVDNTEGEEFSLHDFEQAFFEYEYWTCTSRSHQKIKAVGKDRKECPPADRFHFLLPLAAPVTDPDVLQSYLRAFIKAYPFCDKSVNDAPRFFFGAEVTKVGHNYGRPFDLAVLQEYMDQTHLANPTGDDIPEFLKTDGPTGFEEIEEQLPDILSTATNRKKMLDALADCAKRDMFKDRNDWVKLASALEHAGYTVDDFKALSYPDERTQREAVRVWETRGKPRATTGSLFHFAREVHPRLFFRETATAFAEINKAKNDEAKRVAKETIAIMKESGDLALMKKTIPDDLWYRDHCEIFIMKGGEEVIKPRSTIENIRIMLDFYGIVIRENQMSHDIEIMIPGFIEKEGNVKNAKLKNIASIATQNKLNGERVVDLIDAIAYENSYHPFRQWVEGVQWDGHDYIHDVFNTLHVAPGYDPSFAYTLFRKWAISQIAVLYEPEPHARGVLTLQGPQGMGKTSFFKNLYPSEKEFFLESLIFDPHNKDKLIEALSHVCCEMGELEATFKRDLAALKAWITSQTDMIRAPYARKHEKYLRRTVLCATVNDSQFLIDETGNTRFWVIRVASVDYMTKINKQQFWAQVKKEYEDRKARKEKAIWWLSDGENDILAAVSKPHYSVSMYEDLILSMFDFTKPPAQVLNNTEIARKIGIDRPTQRDTRAINAWIKNSGLVEIGRTRTRKEGWSMPLERSDTERTSFEFVRLDETATREMIAQDERIASRNVVEEEIPF